MDWSVFHNYRRLAQEGKAKVLLCPNCSFPLVTQATQASEPYLWCMKCDNRLVPGLDLYDQLKAVVKEHYLE